MTESADVLDLGSSAEKRAGSNPVLGTNAAVAQLVEQRIFNPWVECLSHFCGTNPCPEIRVRLAAEDA